MQHGLINKLILHLPLVIFIYHLMGNNIIMYNILALGLTIYTSFKIFAHVSSVVHFYIKVFYRGIFFFQEQFTWQTILTRIMSTVAYESQLKIHF